MNWFAEILPLFIGLDNDSSRSTKFPPQGLRGRQGYPVTFGSYHHGAFNAAFCDGSVRQVTYGVDVEIFRVMGTRDRQEVGVGE